ncbi:helix-turn-helix domain-containing protein [Kocuria sp. M4R2S49]|uniref:AraC-like ligand-binding domain-containing protein n=1 Tax=Kocuria rhizosphaericola TaxID=3376284 RepID=UPI0037B47B8D
MARVTGSAAATGRKEHFMVPTLDSPVTDPAIPVLAETIRDWSLLTSQSFGPLKCSTRATRTFQAGLVARKTGSLDIAHMRVGPHVVEREATTLGQEGGRFKVSLQLEGRGIVEQGERTAVLEAGDMALYDTSAPYRLEFPEDSRLLVMMFDHSALDLPPNAAAQLRAQRVGAEEPVHAMVSSFLASVAGRMEALSGMTGQRIGNSALDLLTVSFNHELDGQVASSIHEQDRLRASVHDFIEAHLADPELDPTMIAQAHFMSTRRLHQIFHNEGTTVSTWIRTRRLERCRRALEDPANTRISIARIAERWGFTDGAHFSRVFRAAYGVPPSQIRSRSLNS